MKRRISVTLDEEMFDWLDSIYEHRIRDRGGTIRQLVKLAKRADETGEIQHDPVCHIAFEPTRRYLLQDVPATTGNIIPFPGTG